MKRRTTFIWASLLVCALASGLTAATLNVPTGYATIQAAIDAASPGDTIMVDDGVYNENVNVTKAVTLGSV